MEGNEKKGGIEMFKRSHWMLLTFVMVISFGFPGSPVKAQEVKISYSDWQLAQDIWGGSLRETIAE